MDGTIGNIGLSVDKNGKVKQTIGNCVTVINYDDRLKEMFRYNEMTDRIEVLGAWWNQSSVNLSDNDLNNIRLYLETIYGLAHEKTIPRAIDIIAHQRSYHPVRKYLAGLRWDGGKYIENLLPKYLGAEKSDYTTQALKLTMLGAIERVHNPSVKFETMMCLVEDEQGGGKSTIARLLACKDEWFTDDIKNLMMKMCTVNCRGIGLLSFRKCLLLPIQRRLKQ